MPPKATLRIPSQRAISIFWQGVVTSNECWDWAGSVNGRGYAQVRSGKDIIGIHRISFYIHFGYMPENVLHSCDNKRCSNPYHLYDGTHSQNMKDASERKLFLNSKKTHCKNDHEFSKENTIIKKNNKNGRSFRQCRKCNIDYQKQWRLRRNNASNNT